MPEKSTARQHNVKIYGADWCGRTRRTLAHLDGMGVEYEYIDVDHDSAASEWVKQQNAGKEKKPTVDIDGQVITYPTNEQLDEILGANVS